MKLYKDGITCEIADTERTTIERLISAGYEPKVEQPKQEDKTKKEK